VIARVIEPAVFRKLVVRAGGRPKALQAAAAGPVIRVPALEAPAVLGGPPRRRLGQEQRGSQEET